MKIEIIGSGCPRCKELMSNARKAVAEIGVEAEIVKVSEIKDIIERGVMVTPALSIDGEVVSAGKVLSSDEIKKIISNKKEA